MKVWMEGGGSLLMIMPSEELLFGDLQSVCIVQEIRTTLDQLYWDVVMHCQVKVNYPERVGFQFKVKNFDLLNLLQTFD